MHHRSPPRVRVVNKPTILHPTQQPRILPHTLQRIPPHMRRLQLRAFIQSREALTHPRKVPQPSNSRSLGRSLKQPLQPNTNPQKPCALRDTLPHRLCQPKLRQQLRSLKMPHPRQHHLAAARTTSGSCVTTILARQDTSAPSPRWSDSPLCNQSQQSLEISL